MTAAGEQAAAAWRDESFARSWADGDSFRDLLNFPRHLAAAIVEHDNPAPATIIDVAAGPGAVLAVFLDAFPGAKGIWTDASEAMLDLAKENLARFGDRVTYRLADMTDLSAVTPEGSADVITTSRAAHHLDRDALARFYADAASRLQDGGWLVNLDHIGPDDVWDQRLRAVRKQFSVADGPKLKHHHNYPLTSVADHLDGFAAAGVNDVEIPWRAFYTCLFTGRKAG
ncbi:MAG: class I SAM-dependent methyltransferase [Streptosporangiales bacterium]|nr:class I SAM-dependent methyltransferase [Streptosporangiales bacterium]